MKIEKRSFVEPYSPIVRPVPGPKTRPQAVVPAAAKPAPVPWGSWLDRTMAEWWTIRPQFMNFPVPPAQPWTTALSDPTVGQVQLTGLLTEVPKADDIVIVVHGVGSDDNAGYDRALATQAVGRGVSVLRMNLRGADLSGTDIYSAGVTADVAAAIASPALAHYKHIRLIGCSMGGHVVLRYAADHPDARVASVTAVSAPLELEESTAQLDANWLFGQFALNAVKKVYRAFYDHHPALDHQRFKSPDVVDKAKTVEEFDDLVSAPRWGYASGADYRRYEGLKGRIADITVPTTIIESFSDPIIPQAVVNQLMRLAQPSTRLITAWGGHVYMPDNTNLGITGHAGYFAQVMALALGDRPDRP